MASIHEMLTDSLRDMYDAERQAVKSIPKLARAASSPELKQAFQQHLEVTKGQVARLEQVFEILGERAKAKPCKAMQGLVAEAMEHVAEHDKGSELDAVLIAAGQKIEHYEIASYGTARAMAKAAGQKEAANLLQETLTEEEATDKQLTKIALALYREMVREEGRSEAGVDEEVAISKGSARGNGRGPAPKKKVAAQESNSGTGTKASKSASGGGPKTKQARGGKAGSDAVSSVTFDHDEIRAWAEERGAHPASVRGTGKQNDTGLLRLDFPGYTGGDSLEQISWDDFFEKFDKEGLALLHQETAANGERSNFNKLVSRTTAQAGGGGRRGAKKRGS